MNTELLRVFLLVASEGSISAAAERLHFSQPAVSKRLRSLEESIGEELFLRHNRGVELTEAGIRVREYAERITQLEEALQEELESLRAPAPKVIEVAATQFVSSSLLPCLLWGFQTAQPHIDVRVTTAHAETVLRLIRDSAVHLGVVEGPVEKDGDLEFEELGKEPLVAVASPTAVEDARREGRVLNLLLPDRGTGIRRVLENSRTSEQLLGRSLVDNFLSLDSLKVAALNGLGCALLPRVYVQRELLGGSLVICSPADGRYSLLELPYAFVWRKERRLPSEYIEFMEHTTTCAQPIPLGRVSTLG